ncbi:short-chain dehydrogenase [Corynebacterium hadale]|uniref:Short-chain dehydrogenase n=2 Tax=Corynebacterium hadale TaxID=2026255 RepID=A0ABX4H9Y0_9CORY|nr:short-chain dehydrogenase [Corynebacterium hadale]
MHQTNKKGSRVLITGGAHGIGSAVAERCREDGYEVIVFDREGEDSVHCDLSDLESTRAALETVLEEGPITRLVNNVGAVFPNTLENQSIDEFDAAMRINLRSAFLCSQALVPGMKSKGFGRIVSLSSRASLGKEARSAYSASKAGLIGMTRTWALELGRHGITCNTVAPGPIATKLFNHANPESAPRTTEIINSIPVQRMGTPEDVAHTVSYFLDNRSGFVTGQTAYVCGGLSVGVAHV